MIPMPTPRFQQTRHPMGWEQYYFREKVLATVGSLFCTPQEPSQKQSVTTLKLKERPWRPHGHVKNLWNTSWE